MKTTNNLTKKQAYLNFLVPKLSDHQIELMITAAAADPAQSRGGAKEEKDSFAELMGMIGCENAKATLKEMIADFRIRKIAAMRGRKGPRAYYHAVFTGNPGCAKTTCARLFAKALAKEGITKNDRFAELSRSGLVGQYVGATAQKVQDVFRKNAGGVIFVDEAYSLVDRGGPGSNNDYGEEAINEIITCLENSPETVVIFAGYPDKMEEFIDANPGLKSRVPYKVAFEDYTTEELIAISSVIAQEQGYSIAEGASEKLVEIYEAARAQKNFGNGRYVRNLVESAVRIKGIKLGVMDGKSVSDFLDRNLYPDEELFTLDESCFNAAEEEMDTQDRRIGFCA